MHQDQPIDLNYLNEYTDGDPEAMQELIEAFIETADEGVATLEDNIVDGESEEWCRAAHTLKGAAGYVGAEKLKSLCAQAQESKVASQDQREAMLNTIKLQYVEVRKYLEGEIK